MTASHFSRDKKFGFTKTLSITSGKGGVGKTSMTANLGLQLARQGHRVLLLDGDLSMANLDIFFGVRPVKTLYDALVGSATVEDVLLEVDENLFLLPGGSGVRELQNLDEHARRDLLNQIGMLNYGFDYMLIDTAPGIDANVLTLNAAADEVAVIVTPDPSSLTDAYALIKVLNHTHRIDRFSIICNQVRDEDEGLAQFKRLSDVAQKFLFISLDYRGSVPHDPFLRQAVKNQQLVLKSFEQAPSSKAVKNLVGKLTTTTNDEHLKGGLQIFWNQLFELAC